MSIDDRTGGRIRAVIVFIRDAIQIRIVTAQGATLGTDAHARMGVGTIVDLIRHRITIPVDKIGGRGSGDGSG